MKKKGIKNLFVLITSVTLVIIVLVISIFKFNIININNIINTINVMVLGFLCIILGVVLANTILIILKKFFGNKFETKVSFFKEKIIDFNKKRHPVCDDDIENFKIKLLEDIKIIFKDLGDILGVIIDWDIFIFSNKNENNNDDKYMNVFLSNNISRIGNSEKFKESEYKSKKCKLLKLKKNNNQLGFLLLNFSKKPVLLEEHEELFSDVQNIFSNIISNNIIENNNTQVQSKYE